MSAKFLLNNSNDEVFRELFIATKLLPADEVLIDGKRHVLHIFSSNVWRSTTSLRNALLLW